MTEQDNIRDLFSKGLESHTTPVRPEIWNGLQAKMAAAGIASGSAAAVKGISVLTKWIIGGAAATAIAVTTVVLTTDTKEADKKEKQSVAFSSADSQIDKQIAQNGQQSDGTDVASATISEQQAERKTESLVRDENDLYIDQLISPPVPEMYQRTQPDPNDRNDHLPVVNPQAEFKQAVDPKKEEIQKTEQIQPETKVETKTTSRSKIGAIPNVFTPNNSGPNDDFTVSSKLVTDFSVTIMNNRGAVVFKSSDPDFTWDGKSMNGEEAPAGSYVCIIIARGENGEMLKEYKPVEVIR